MCFEEVFLIKTTCVCRAVSTVIQLYRGKYGIMEYVGAGAATGFMYKFNAGPRGWVVGSGLGKWLISISSSFYHNFFCY